MPFKSKAQRRFMYAKHPELAREFEASTTDKNLPERLQPTKNRTPKRNPGGIADRISQQARARQRARRARRR